MKEWISQAEAARLKGVSRQAISKQVQQGRIRTLTIGGHVLVHIDDIQKKNSSIQERETDVVQQVKALLISAPDKDRREAFDWLRESNIIHPLEDEFGAPAEVILEAISRSSDLTKRGVRGVIAEAVFSVEVVDQLSNWQDLTPEGDHPYDFLVGNKSKRISIQVKMQRKKAQRPMMANEGYTFLDPNCWVVETQRTRGGKSTSGEDTRPYKFGEFDLLAVSMNPTSGKWTDFLYTVSNWLLERPENANQILKFQPVPKQKNDDWTNSLEEAIGWFLSGRVKKIRGRI